MIKQTMHRHGCCESLINNNMDVMTKILCCLPLKSLVRFKSVDKTWYNNISSRDFFRRYRDKKKVTDDDDKHSSWGLLTRHHETGCLSMALSEHCNGLLFPIDGGYGELIRCHFTDSAPVIVGPLDGLICIYEAPQCLPKSHPWRKTIALCNPFLGGKVEIIPPPPLSLNGNTHCYCGFGYDSLTRDYKIVMVLLSYNNGRSYNNFRVEVYSRATNSWKELDCSYFLSRRGDISFIRPIMPYQEGSFAHWHAWQLHPDGLYYRIVLSFDMRNEVFELTALPSCFSGVRPAVKGIASREVKEYSLGIGIHSKDDYLALDYSPSKKEMVYQSMEVEEAWWRDLTSRVEIDLSPREENIMGNNHGIIHQFSYVTRAFKLRYISPQGTLLTMQIPNIGQLKYGSFYVFKYEPSLIELK